MSKLFESKDAAGRYDPARSLPDETLALWMDTLRELVPAGSVASIVDLGAGTGRFAATLRDAFGCAVVAVEPSEAMLDQGRGRVADGVQWLAGSAESIPLEDASVDLVWMSQVFHHLDDPVAAFREIRRVLTPGGHLAMRNATLETEADNQWARFFPGVPTVSVPRDEMIRVVCGGGFDSVAALRVPQVFAASHSEYCEKVGLRAMSCLLVISDEAFTAGMERLKQWVATQPANQPVVEPLDFLVFKRRPVAT